MAHQQVERIDVGRIVWVSLYVVNNSGGADKIITRELISLIKSLHILRPTTIKKIQGKVTSAS